MTSTPDESQAQRPRSTPVPPAFWLAVGVASAVMTLLLGVLAHPLVGLGFAVVMLLLSYVMLRTTYSAREISRMAWRTVRRVVAAPVPYLTLISREFGVLSLFFFGLAAWHYAVGGMDWVDKAAWLLFAGVVTMLASVVIGWQHHTGAFDESGLPAESAPGVRTRTRYVPLVIGLVLLFLVADVSGDVWEPDFLADVTIHAQFVMLCAGIGLVTWGVGGKRVGVQALPPRPPLPYGEGEQNHTANRATTSEGEQARIEQMSIDAAGEQAVVRTPDRAFLQRVRGFLRRYGRELLAVAVILVIATFARVYHIGSAVHLFIDEIHFTNPIVIISDNDDVELLEPFSSVAAFPYIFPYIQWWFVEPLDYGRNLVGLRLGAAVFGVLNVVALYLMTRELFGVKTALLAAALLAVFPPHLQYSRIGLNNIADPVFGMMAVYFIVRGLRRREHLRMNFALAGAMLGLTQYWYEGGRLLYPPVIVAWMALIGGLVYAAVSGRWLIGKVFRRDRDRQAALDYIERIDLRNLVKAVVVLVVVAVIVGAPVYYTLAGMDRPFLARLDSAGLRDNTTEQLQEADDVVQHVAGRVNLAYLMHVAIPEAWLYYGGFTPMLLAFMVPFFLLGVFYAAWRFDKAGTSLLLIWLVATWLGNSLLQESRISARYVVAFPALMVFVSIGMMAAVKMLWPRNPRTRNRILAAMLSAFMVLNFTYYFGHHTETMSNQFRDDPNLGRDSHDVLFRAARLPAGTHVHMVGQPVMTQLDANGYMTYLNPSIRVQTIQTNDMNSAYVSALDTNVPHAFFIAPDDGATLLLLARYFPHALGPSSSPYDVPADEEYVLYYAAATIPAETAPADEAPANEGESAPVATGEPQATTPPQPTAPPPDLPPDEAAPAP